MSQGLEPHLFVILGATGDLARRKLLPAVYRLTRDGALSTDFRILGVSRDKELDDTSYRSWVREALEASGVAGEELDDWCDDCLLYQSVREGGGYEALAARIAAIEEEAGLPGNRLFYLAVPPAAFAPSLGAMAEVGLHQAPGWCRLVIEKPFGEDLESAQALNRTVHRWFDESQIYRIDHYLGKETVQNLLVFRFANAMFESLWNRDHVEDVQITVAESIGVGERVGYYDGVGALRDMVQNHLTQLLTLVAMEVPAAYEAGSVRSEKIKVLRSIKTPVPEKVVYGQYVDGTVDGDAVVAYRDEAPPQSLTETFVALELSVDNWRWQGVPFYLRTGKRLERRLTEIVVTFRRPPVSLFESLDCSDVDHDVLVITLQPEEGFSLYFDVKRPGEPLILQKRDLRFRYEDAFGPLADAYVTLLLDVLTGDQTLFVHADEVEASWRVYSPLLERNIHVYDYPSGSWGPRQSDQLLAASGRIWRSD